MMERGFQIALLAALFLPNAASSQDGTGRTFSSGFRFVEMSGEELYNNVCRACHMMDARGAAGAGTYPSLAANPNLEAAGIYWCYLRCRQALALLHANGFAFCREYGHNFIMTPDSSLVLVGFGHAV